MPEILKKRKKAEPEATIYEQDIDSAAYDDKAPVRKQKKKISAGKAIKSALRIAIPALILIGISVAAVQLLRLGSSYKFTGPASQYYLKQAFSIPEGAVITPDGEGGATLKVGTYKRNIDQIPAYYQNENKVVLAADMLLFTPRENKVFSIKQITEVGYDGGGMIYAERGRSSATAGQGFFFDGGNIYVFTEAVTLRFNGYKYELGPMSLVEADIINGVFVYNNSTGEMIMEVPTTDVVATSAYGEYSVSLLGDSMTRNDGSKTLLFNDPKQIKSLYK